MSLVLSGPRLAAVVLAGALALAIAHSVYRVPIQVSDSLEEIVAAREAPSAGALAAASLSGAGRTLRPLRRVQTRWLLQLQEVTGLSYHAIFRGLHAALAVGIVLLFVGAVPVRDWLDVGALGAALTVLVGHHTFSGMLREAYPVNHYAVVTLGCLLVVVLARGSRSWTSDVLIAAALGYALFLVESGALIWVAVAGALAVGLPGIGRRTLLLSTAVLAVYGVTRLAFGIPAPGIGEHGSGYLGQYYEADELVALFGERSWAFRAYNVAGALASVLLSEPRYGVFTTVAGWVQGGVNPVVGIHLASSALATAALVWYLLARRRAPRGEATEHDRLFALSLVLIACNSLFAASYIKDEIISPAGVFYAVAVFVALRGGIAAAAPPRIAAMLTVVLACGAALWGFRALGLHFELRAFANPTRADWVTDVDPSNLDRWSRTPDGRTLVTRLRNEAIAHRGTSASFLPRWGERYWVE
jgi:hypothetical protein